MKRAPHAPSPLTLALCAALAAGLSPAAQAQTDNPADMVQARILPGWSGTDGGHMAALQLTLSPGWKTYWRAPGDAGIPPAMNFQGSHNLASVTPVWPTPEVFLQNGMQTVGYDGQLVLPLRIMPQDSTRPARVAGRLQIGICSTICVPVDLDFALDLPASGSDPQQAMIRAALADQPISAAKASVGDVDCTLSPISDGLGLTVEIDMPSAGGTETVLIETVGPAGLGRRNRKHPAGRHPDRDDRTCACLGAGLRAGSLGPQDDRSGHGSRRGHPGLHRGLTPQPAAPRRNRRAASSATAP